MGRSQTYYTSVGIPTEVRKNFTSVGEPTVVPGIKKVRLSLAG